MKNSLLIILLFLFSTTVFSQKKEITSIAKEIQGENYQEAQKLLDLYKTTNGSDAAYLFFLVKNKTAQPILKGDVKTCITQLQESEKTYNSLNEKDRAHYCKKLSFCQNSYVNSIKDASKLYWNFLKQERELDEINQFLNDFPNLDFQSEVILLRDELVYSKIQNSSKEEDFRNFISYYPASIFSNKAQQKIEELAFGRAQTKNTREEYAYFIQLYPNSLLVTKAEEKILGIEWSGIKESNDIAQIKKFNSDHANSAYGEESRKLIASYEWQILSTSEGISAIEEWAQANINYPEAALANERVLQLKDVVLPYLTKNRTYKFFYVLSKKIDESNEYDKVSRLDNNDFFVMKNNLLGIVNNKGKEIVKTEFSNIQRTGSNYLVFGNKKYQILKSSGEKIKDLNYKFISPPTRMFNIENEYSLVWNLVNGIKKCGVINSQGKEIIPVKYDYIMVIKSGFLLYTKGSPKNLCDLAKDDGTVILSKVEFAVCSIDGYYFFQRNGKFGVVKSNGQILFEPVYAQISMEDTPEFVLHFDNNMKCITDSLGNELLRKGNYNRIDHLAKNIYRIGNWEKFDLYNTKTREYFGSQGYEEANVKICPNFILLGKGKEIEIIEAASFRSIKNITVEEHPSRYEYKDGPPSSGGYYGNPINNMSSIEFDKNYKPDFASIATDSSPWNVELSRYFNSSKYATFKRLGNYVLIDKSTGEFLKLFPPCYLIEMLCDGFFLVKKNESDLYKIIDMNEHVIKDSITWGQGLSKDELIYTISEGNSIKSYLLNTTSNTTKQLGIDISSYTAFDDYQRYSYKDIQVYELSDGTKLYDKSIDFNKYEATQLISQADKIRLQNNDEAIRLYEESLKLNPRNYNVYTSLSNCYINKNQLEKALAWVNKAIYENPEYSESYYLMRIRIYEKQDNKYGMACDYNTIASKSKTMSIYYYRESSYIYNQSNYFYETIRVCNEAISKNKVLQKDNNLAGLYNNLGKAHFSLAQYSAAINDYNNAIKWVIDYNTSEKAMYLDNLGASYLSMGNNAMACKYFKLACALGKCTNTWRCR